MKTLRGHWIAGSPGLVPRPARVLGIQLPGSWSTVLCSGFGSRHGGKRSGGTATGLWVH